MDGFFESCLIFLRLSEKGVIKTIEPFLPRQNLPAHTPSSHLTRFRLCGTQHCGAPPGNIDGDILGVGVA